MNLAKNFVKGGTLIMPHNEKAYGFACLNRANALATELYAVLVGEADCNY